MADAKTRALALSLERSDHGWSVSQWGSWLWEQFRPYRDAGLPPEPTAALPGSAAKRAVLAQRASRRFTLFHPRDLTYEELLRLGRAVTGFHGRFYAGDLKRDAA